ncbi:leucine-rich repeat domain-containing protein [Treponema socranskii]|nr:leucine-rich repeat domain-containing protein [Treponema socranskii]MDR9858897.1 leucine-rich repeat domain-containing protein [Treponema socranskii]
MTKRESDSVSGVYTVAVTVEHEGITYTLTGFSEECVSEFSNLSSLEAFALSGETAFLSVDGGVLFDKAKTKLIRYPTGKTDTSYTVPDSVTVLGESSFKGNDTLTAIALPTGLTTIEDGALYCCYELKTVNIPSTLTSIGNAFLGYSEVEDVKIPEGITKLDYMFLYECKKLKTLELPSTFTKQLRSDFCTNCTALQSVTCRAVTPPALGAGPFSGVVLAGVTLKVPSASVSAYETASFWKDFKKPFLTLP